MLKGCPVYYILPVLIEICRLLSDVQVVYPTPNRISLDQTLKLVNIFASDKSGGDRIETVCTALFKAIANRFNLFDNVKRQKVNAADASSGMSADIECYLNNKIVLLVEVKDRSLSLTQLDTKLDIARSKKISEILFLAEQGIEKEDVGKTEKRILSEFTSGQNIYISNFLDFSAGILILLGEKGRVEFLSNIGTELDQANSAIVHRKTCPSSSSQAGSPQAAGMTFSFIRDRVPPTPSSSSASAATRTP